jgi:O-antigen/teichoic acid export membrane protein
VAGFGTAQYGLFSLFWAGSLIGTVLTTGWARQAILRHSGSAAPGYLQLPRGWRLCLESAPLLTLGPIAAVALPAIAASTDRWAFLTAAALGLLATSRYGLAQALAQRDGAAGRYATAESVRAATALGYSLVFLALGQTHAWAIVLANVAATLTALPIIRQRTTLRLAPARESAALLRSYWSFGWPMSLWLAGSACLTNVDRFFLSAAHGLGTAGAYAAAADLVVRGMGMVVAPVVMFLHPTFMRTWNTAGREHALRTWRRATATLTLVTVAVSVVGFLGYLAFADQFLEHPVSPATFALLVVGGATWQLALMVHKPLEAADQTRLMLLALVISILVTVGLDMAFAGTGGAPAVAAGFTAGALTYVVLAGLLDLRVLRPAPLPSSRLSDGDPR